MIANRELKLDDYLQILKRRKWLLIVPILLAPIAAFLVSFVFPPRYTSQALLLVLQPQVPEGLVRPVVSQELVERIATLQGRIESRDTLLPLVERYHLQNRGVSTSSVDDVINDARQSIELTPVETEFMTPVSARNQEVPGFYITYTDQDPRVAQQMCSELTSAFISEDLKMRGQMAQAATQFLASQLLEARHTQEQKSIELATFKSKYFGQLPSQQEDNVKVLMTLNTRLEALTENLNRAEQEKSYAQSLLADQIASWNASQAATSPAALQQQLVVLQSQLISLQSRYTDEYPEVIRVKADIAEVSQKLKEAEALAEQAGSGQDAPSPLEPPEIQKLRAQVRQYDQMIQQTSSEQKQMESEIQRYQQRLQVSPAVQEEYDRLSRDYDAAQKFYNDLLEKEKESRMGADVELQQQGEQFRLSDPASLPSDPSFPNRLMITGGGLGAGFALAFALMVWFEFRDTAIRCEDDVTACLELPTLAVLPWLADAEQLELLGNGNWRQGNGFRPKRKEKTEAVR
jgi:polysaccharide chain length determinant protein (PEP-CTERM system associated)